MNVTPVLRRWRPGLAALRPAQGRRATLTHPIDDRDRFFAAMLKPLGVEKGKPFQPDERQTRILTEAALAGEAMAKANDFVKRFPGTRYRTDTHWEHVILADPEQDLEDYSQLDERAARFCEAIFLTQAMVSRPPGFGQAYPGAYHDKDGHAFDGGQSYRLHAPLQAYVDRTWRLPDIKTVAST